jgi:hypothetical protein
MRASALDLSRGKPCGEASVHIQGRAGNPARLVRKQEVDGMRNVGGLADSPHRRDTPDVIQSLFGIDPLVEHHAEHRPWAHGIYTDVLVSMFERCGLGEAHDGMLGCAIGREPWRAPMRRAGRDIDDRAAVDLQHFGYLIFEALKSTAKNRERR